MYQHKNINTFKPFGLRMAEDAELGVRYISLRLPWTRESEGVTSFTPHYNNLEDLESAVNFLEKGHAMTAECIFGYSAGGNVAVLYAAKHPGHVPFITSHSARSKMDGIRATLTPE
jgi:dienelactone hydrolase